MKKYHLTILGYYGNTTYQTSIKCDGMKAYDAETLAQMVKPTVLKKVTKLVVENDLMDSAIKMGLIDEQVAATVASVTPYSQVRVTPISAEAKAKKQSIAQAS